MFALCLQNYEFKGTEYANELINNINSKLILVNSLLLRR